MFTVFEGRMGAVDERLIADGRLRRLQSASQVELAKRITPGSAPRTRRDPALLVDLLLSARESKLG